MRTGRLTIIGPLAAALLAACALAVAACGGDDGGGAASAADREREFRDAALRYARCFREHGVNVPDPSFDGGRTMPSEPDEDVPTAKLREAEQACREYDPEANAPTLSEEEQQEFREAALANARCLREHGIENFPDPTFDERGAAIPKVEGFDPQDPDLREAEEACQDTAPPKPSEESGQ